MCARALGAALGAYFNGRALLEGAPGEGKRCKSVPSNIAPRAMLISARPGNHHFQRFFADHAAKCGLQLLDGLMAAEQQVGWKAGIRQHL